MTSWCDNHLNMVQIFIKNLDMRIWCSTYFKQHVNLFSMSSKAWILVGYHNNVQMSETTLIEICVVVSVFHFTCDVESQHDIITGSMSEKEPYLTFVWRWRSCSHGFLDYNSFISCDIWHQMLKSTNFTIDLPTSIAIFIVASMNRLSGPYINFLGKL